MIGGYCSVQIEGIALREFGGWDIFRKAVLKHTIIRKIGVELFKQEKVLVGTNQRLLKQY